MEKITTHATGVGLITSNGAHGQNVMACEWTHQISYAPLLLMVCIRKGKATFDNIQETKEFGVNIASIHQNVLSSIAGNNHGNKIDKISVLKELGFSFYPAETINTQMIEGSYTNAECKLIKFIDIGDHPVFIGEVQKVTQSEEEEPIIYHKGKYFRIGDRIYKPDQEKLEEINDLIKKYSK